MRGRLLAVALPAVVLLVVVACRSEAKQPAVATATNGLPVVTFQKASGGTAKLSVEVADTPELQQCGLMHRLSMPADQAMIFIFANDYRGQFYNRNTFIPLSLAWIASDGRILGFSELVSVKPEDTPQVNSFYDAPGPSRYVIEANQGWFKQAGVQVGDRADVSEAVKAGSQGAVPICREKGL